MGKAFCLDRGGAGQWRLLLEHEELSLEPRSSHPPCTDRRAAIDGCAIPPPTAQIPQKLSPGGMETP